LREQWEGCGLQYVRKAKDQISNNCAKICCGPGNNCLEESTLGLHFDNCKRKCMMCKNDAVLKTYVQVKDNISGRKLEEIESLLENMNESGFEQDKNMVELAGTGAGGNAKLNYEHYNYILVSCFTGWGTVSVKFLNEYTKEHPKMSTCEGLFPHHAKYSLRNLDAVVDSHVQRNG